MSENIPVSEEAVEAGAYAVALQHYAKRFDRAPDDDYIVSNAKANWFIFAPDARLAIEAALPFLRAHPVASAAPADREEVAFLLDRLDELEQSILSDKSAEELYREFAGHVAPPAARLRAALKGKSPPAPQPEAAPERREIVELVKRLRNDAERAGKEIHTFERVSGALASQLTMDVIQAADAIAALQQESPRAVVKPLEWTFEGESYFEASGIFGTKYTCVRSPRGDWLWRRPSDDLWSRAPGENEAKAAAQADYEARILSALAHPLHQPAPDAGTIVAWRYRWGGDEAWTLSHRRPNIKSETLEAQPLYAVPAPEPQAPVPEIDRITQRIAELDEQITAYPSWGAALTAMDEERRGLQSRLSVLRRPAQAPVPDGVITEAIVEKAARAVFEAMNGCPAPKDMSPPYGAGSKVGMAWSYARAALTASAKQGSGE